MDSATATTTASGGSGRAGGTLALANGTATAAGATTLAKGEAAADTALGIDAAGSGPTAFGTGGV